MPADRSGEVALDRPRAQRILGADAVTVDALNSLLLIVTCASALPPAMLMPSPPIGPFRGSPRSSRSRARWRRASVSADGFKAVARDVSAQVSAGYRYTMFTTGPADRFPSIVHEPSAPVRAALARTAPKVTPEITAAPLPAPVSSTP